MLSRLSIPFFCAALLSAQQTVTPSSTGELPTDKIGDYNVIQSFEAGYRAVSVSGDDATYRSQVNFGDGIRLFGSDLEANSLDGHGSLFDQLSLRTQGLGNDPYESAQFRVEKNHWYEYSLNWRLQDYFNPGLTTVGGAHFENVQHRLQDHDLTLFPQSRVKVTLGYSRSAEDGPALTSFVDLASGTVPLFEDIRRVQDEYRVGVDATFAGFHVNVLHTWELFREDSQSAASSPTGAEFQRTQPNHGETPGWQLFLARGFGNTFAINGRVTYQGAGRGSIVNEFAPLFGSIVPTEQIVVTGEASRPMTAANLNLTWSPTEKFSVTNQTSFDQIRMNGNDTYLQFDNGTLDSTVVNFQFLGIKHVSDAVDINYQALRWLGIDLGYEYSNRAFRSIAQASDNQEPAAGSFGQTNTLNAGKLGIRLRPIKPLLISFRGEVGRASRPLTPVADGNYQTFDGRVQYRAGTLTLGVTGKADYNINTFSFTNFLSHSRTYGADASWAPRSWLSFDASVSKLHLYSIGGLFYLANGSPVTGTDSLYISNLYFGNLGLRIAAGHRAEIFLGYSRVQDTGDGRSTAEGNGNNPIAAFNVAQTYPLTYETPLARITIPIAPRLRFNAGWQFYRYNEQFFQVRDYHANTAYTSLAWSF